jgi:hypothetical protein
MYFKSNRADVDAAMRAKFQRAPARPKPQKPKQAKMKITIMPPLLPHAVEYAEITRMGVEDETQIETKSDVPAEPEKVEPANVLQERVPESASVARTENVDNGTVPTRQSTNGRKTFQIWTISSEEFREDMFSAPHLRRGKIR